MLDYITPVNFFLGANTPTGFLGYLEDLYDCRDGWHVYLIKSGAGTGKSSLMRGILEQMTATGHDAEVIRCSSDPQSLDGVLFHDQKLGILDATAPHIIEPKYWGAVETIVNLGTCMNTARLREQAPAVIQATDACSALHERCRKFIGAAAALLSESTRIAQNCTDKEKVSRCAARIAAREFGSGSGQYGKETRRFLSAVTPEGPLIFHETLQALCPRIYALEDEYGAASRLLLAELRQRALNAGLSIVTCACPLSPQDKPEHLLIPSIGVGFTTSNSWHKAAFPVYRRLHAARFTDSERLRAKRQTLSFNRRAVRELINEAVQTAAQAKAAHDRIEEFYGAAMDWEQVGILSRQVIDEFLHHP